MPKHRNGKNFADLSEKPERIRKLSTESKFSFCVAWENLEILERIRFRLGSSKSSTVHPRDHAWRQNTEWLSFLRQQSSAVDQWRGLHSTRSCMQAKEGAFVA